MMMHQYRSWSGQENKNILPSKTGFVFVIFDHERLALMHEREGQGIKKSGFFLFGV